MQSGEADDIQTSYFCICGKGLKPPRHRPDIGLCKDFAVRLLSVQCMYVLQLTVGADSLEFMLSECAEGLVRGPFHRASTGPLTLSLVAGAASV